MSLPIKVSAPATGGFWEIPVLFEDEHMLALNKPPGLLVSPDPEAPDQPSLMPLLHAGIADGKPWARARNLSHLASAHRLDAEGSGVLLLAKSKTVHAQLANLFGSNQPLKTCVALLCGTPPHPEWEMDAPITPHPSRPGLMCVAPRKGKKAVTRFSVREQFRGHTLVECRPVTDRPHQIRLHLKHCGLPICGDQPYGGKPLLLSQLKSSYHLKPGHIERPLLSSAALHVEKLELNHTVTGQPLAITAEWPNDFSVAVKYLRRYGA